jgi:hypothetical protein
MLEEKNLLEIFKSIEFVVVEDYTYFKPLSFNEIFGCQTLYISTKEEKTFREEEVKSEEGEITDIEFKTIEGIIFHAIRVRFNTHGDYAQFKREFEKFYDTSKKSFLFWINAKLVFNQQKAEQKEREIEALSNEIVEIEESVEYIYSKKKK